MTSFDSLKPYLPEALFRALSNAEPAVASRVTELRIRKGKPLVAVIRNTSYFMDYNGDIYDTCGAHCITVSAGEFERIFMELCSYSLHTHMETLKNGFLPLENGMRIGVACSAVYDNGALISVRDVIALNIRIPQEVKHCADGVLNCLYVQGFPSVLVAGKPNSGKTTLLREMARSLSGGFGGKYRKITMIDERLELGGKGEAALDVGLNCDVLSGFSKARGIEIAARTLSPEMIVCDELATAEEASSVAYAFSSGIRFALSVHASSVEELRRKPLVRTLLESGEFSYIIMLDGYSYTPDILDASEVLYEACGNASADAVGNGCRLPSF